MSDQPPSTQVKTFRQVQLHYGFNVVYDPIAKNYRAAIAGAWTEPKSLYDTLRTCETSP